MFNQQPTLGMNPMGGMPQGGAMGNRWSGNFPMGRALPARPNPLARALPVQQNKADIGGIEQAMAKRGEHIPGNPKMIDGMKRSPAGESGLKYKVDKDADSKGEEAFKSLDNYMKKAGLNSFQANFFGRLIQSGLDETAIRAAVKQANARFGVKVAGELNAGLEKLAFAGAMPLLSRLGTGALNFAKGLGSGIGKQVVGPVPQQATRAFRAGQGLNQGVRNVVQQAKTNPLDAAKNVFTGPGARQGAISGALNPYTGLMSNQAFDDDGSVNWTGLAGSTLAGTLGGRALGRIGNVPGMSAVGQTADRMQKQMLAGAGLGGTAGMIGGIAGLPTDFTSGAQLGGLAGFAPGQLNRVPGLRNLATNPNVPQSMQRVLNMPTAEALTKIDPINYGIRKATPYASQAYQFAKANPGTAAKNLAMGGGALATGYGALQIPGAIQSGIENAGQNMLQSPDVQNRLRSLDQVIGEGRSAIAQGREAMGNVNSAVKPFVGQNGQSNWLGGLLSALGGGGQVGQFIQDNQQWLLPALMGGVGAGGGYMLGGGGGAALGGIGLPLLYALANQGGGAGRGGIQQRTVEDASATAMPSEIERQKAQQNDQLERLNKTMLGPGGRLTEPA